jgi:hypothetical protein
MTLLLWSFVVVEGKPEEAEKTAGARQGFSDRPIGNSRARA